MYIFRKRREPSYKRSKQYFAKTSKRSKPYSRYVALMCDLVDQEPTNYDEYFYRKDWVEEMTKEYHSIMKNDVWDIVLL